MKWLVTTDEGLDEGRLDRALASAGARLENTDWQPLEGERVWQVEGPTNLDRALRGVDAITGVFPSSTMTLY